MKTWREFSEMNLEMTLDMNSEIISKGILAYNI